MLAHLISLDRSASRLARMHAEFRRVGVNFQRHRAVDGHALGPEAVAEFRRSRGIADDDIWLPGEIGCFLSHFQVWNEVAKGADLAAVVFEDDVILADDLRSLLANDGWIPADADIVRLEANSRMRLRGGSRVDGVPGRHLFRTASGTWGSAAYVITRETATRLLHVDPRLHRPVDLFLFAPTESPVADALRTYQVVPAVCIQTQLVTSFDGRFPSLIGIEKRKPPSVIKRGGDFWSFLPRRKRVVPFQA